MNRQEALLEQLRIIAERIKQASELNDLINKHNEINSVLSRKTQAALDKDQNGQEVTDAEQAEIDSLARQQEVVWARITKKVLDK